MHKEIADFINSKVSGANACVVEAEVGDNLIFVEASSILEVCKNLKNSDYDMNVLQCVTGTDYEDRIEVSYIIASFTKNSEVIIKAKLPKTSSEATVAIDSVCSVWKSANFLERETYDMLGVVFTNHPDMRRILCPDDWEGYPLRKDYKVQEVYNDMVVDPPEKVNKADHNFFKEIMEKMGDEKKVAYSWKQEEPESAQ
ncbi:NADH-quinone oxidoreductase subunit C [Bacteriovoracaceae bacterium]|nr:NADH-quinone oxidoreductase subunit C [Bacteriovoracaceae bacterium]